MIHRAQALGQSQPTVSIWLAQMREIAAESVAGGAVGFSTSRLLGHRVPDGRCVPGTFASIPEYLAVADGMNDGGGGLFQAVLDFDTKAGHEVQLLQAMAERCGDVLFSGGVGDGGQGPLDFYGTFLPAVRANAGRITTLSMTRPSGTLMGLYQVPPVRGRAWAAVMAMHTIAERVAALKDPATREALAEEGRRKGLDVLPLERRDETLGQRLADLLRDPLVLLAEEGEFIDRNGNGVPDTSSDINNDGDITGDEIRPWGQDECVLFEVILIPGKEGVFAIGTADAATSPPRIRKGEVRRMPGTSSGAACAAIAAAIGDGAPMGIDAPIGVPKPCWGAPKPCPMPCGIALMEGKPPCCA